MAAVTSGRGRNGPWLQNDWIRVETRTDDGSLSPVALAGGFRPTERALAFAELSDASSLGFGRCDYDLRQHEDVLGTGREIELRSRHGGGFVLRREIVLYDARASCVTRVGVTNEGARPVALSALHTFTSAEGRGRLQVSASPAGLRIYRHGWQSWSPTMSLGGAGMDLRSPPAVLAPEQPQPEPGHFASDDVGVLHDPAAGRSLLVGAVSARDFISQVFLDAPARGIDGRCLADGIALAPGETLWSERFAIDVCGTPQQQLERYGEALGREMGARVPPRTPSGWCSWYYFYTQVTEEDVIRNLRYLDQHRSELPVDTVQIDDGYQEDIGDWLTVNDKFPHGMQWLATQIREAGFVPGLWLAPFLLAETSKTFAAHPDWVVRDPSGAPAVAQRNWERNCYGIDGSHPEARAWLTDVFREVCEDWGYDYVKIDFLFGAAIAGTRHDQQATRIRAYRQALAAIREGVGEQRFILGCGALMAPSVGFFDGNRIGPDTAPFWRFLTREQRALPVAPARSPDDHLSGETSTRNVINRWWMHGRLWANDPDCLMVRDARTKLNDDEVETLASVIGLSGGMTLISDDLSLLAQERRELASMFIPPLPRSAVPFDLTSTDMPERFDFVDDRPFDPVRIVGLFNFGDETRNLQVDLPAGRWNAFDLWAGQYLGVRQSGIEFSAVPPHGCRVVVLRPEVRDHPTVVGTDAHIGAGVLDVMDQEWDAEYTTLRLEVSASGRRRRQLWLANPGGEWPLLSVECDGVGEVADFTESGDHFLVRLDVRGACSVDVVFG